MTSDTKRPDCVFVGEAGGVSVQVQANVVSLGMATGSRDGYDGRHVSVGTFLRIEDAAKLSALLARVAEIHAANFTNETAGPRTPAPDADRMPRQVLGTGQGDSVPRAASSTNGVPVGVGEPGAPRPADTHRLGAEGRGPTGQTPPDSERELCPCGELRDDFGTCWKCDAVRP